MGSSQQPLPQQQEDQQQQQLLLQPSQVHKPSGEGGRPRSQPSSSEAVGFTKPPDPRAAAALAALARAGGAAAAAAVVGSLNVGLTSPGQQEQQQKLKPGLLQPAEQLGGVCAPEVVELLSSDDEADDSPAAEMQHGADVIAGASGAGLQLAAQPAAGTGAAAGAVAGLLCPVCCLDFQELAGLNEHLDGCLL